MRVSALLNLSVPGQTSLVLHSLGTKRLGEDRAMSHGRYVRQQLLALVLPRAVVERGAGQRMKSSPQAEYLYYSCLPIQLGSV
jgi:hypothetical protein